MKKSDYKKDISRRDFVNLSAKGVAGAALMPMIITSCSRVKGANDRISVAHIGVGDRGSGELYGYFLPLKEALNVAACDTYRSRRDETAEKINAFYKQFESKEGICKAYLDMDELLERKDIDAVHITTPDHWHVTAAIKAARAGKHVMVAKPLGLCIHQNRLLTNIMKESNLVFHYGTQQRSYDHMQLGYNLIREGAIGEIERVDVWSPWDPGVQSPVCNEAPVPEDFDFDRWTGPAPLRPYCPERVTNISSWFNYDYSIGFLGGWGAHPLDILVWIIKDKVSGRYTSEGTGNKWPEGGLYNTVLNWDVTCRYDNGLVVHFVSEDYAQKCNMLDHRRIKEGDGTTFYGTKGWISLSRSTAESNIPDIDQKLNNFPKSKDGWIQSENNTMGKRFIAAIQGKEQPLSPLDEAIISDTISHMGDIAIRTGRKITWDPSSDQCVGDEEANKLYTREMRPPYTV